MKKEGVLLMMCISILVVIIEENNHMVGAFPSNDPGGGTPFHFPIPTIPTSPNQGNNNNNNNNNNNGAGAGAAAGAGAGARGFQLPVGIGPEHKKCLESFQKDGLGLPCLQDLGNSFQTQRISLSPACCSFLSNIDEACKPVVHFQNPVFQALVHNHCSQHSSTPADSSTSASTSTSDSAAATATGNGGSTVFSDQTGAAAAQPPSTVTVP